MTFQRLTGLALSTGLFVLVLVFLAQTYLMPNLNSGQHPLENARVSSAVYSQAAGVSTEATTEPQNLIIAAGDRTAHLKASLPLSGDQLVGLRAHFETTGTARLYIQWPDGWHGGYRAGLSGLNAEFWANRRLLAKKEEPAPRTTCSIVLVAVRNLDDSDTTVAVARDLHVLTARGGRAIHSSWLIVANLTFEIFLLYAAVMLIQFCLCGEDNSRKTPKWAGIWFIGIVAAVLLLRLAVPQHGQNPAATWGDGPLEFIVYAIWAVALGIGLVLERRAPLRGRNSDVHFGLFFLFLLPAALIRWRWLEDLRFTRLQADALGYLEIAAWMGNPFDGLYREPFFPLLLKCVAPGPGPFGGRLLTYWLSLILGLVLLFSIRRFAPVWVLALTSLLYASQVSLANSAAHVLREELVPLLLLGLIIAVSRAIRFQLPMAWSFAGILAGLLLLTRINTLTIFVPMTLGGLAWWWWRRRDGFGLDRAAQRPVAGPLLMLGIALGMLAPNLLFMHLRHGDPLHASTKHATWYRNAEFAGQPGFITREEFLKNGYAGEQVTWGHYLFRMHTLEQLTSGTLAGLYGFALGKPAQDTLFRFTAERRVNTEHWVPQLPAGPQRWWERVLMVLAAVGWARALFVPGVAMVARLTGWALLLFLLPLAPLQGWGLLPDRLLFTCMPLYLVLLAEALSWGSRCVLRAFGRDMLAENLEDDSRAERIERSLA